MSDIASFADPRVGPMRGNGTAPVNYGDDRSLHVEFVMFDEPQEFESEQKGRPITKPVPYIRIIAPGSKNEWFQRARLKRTGPNDTKPLDSERFPAQWQAFQNQQVQVQGGTSLEDWAPLSRGMVMGFKAMGIHTVEQLGGLADTNAEGRAPLEWRKYRDKAIVWLEQAAGNAPMAAVQQENATLKADLEMLKKQMAELSAARTKETL